MQDLHAAGFRKAAGLMNRDITNRINRFMDNWVPSAIRDNRVVTMALFRIVIGKKYKYYMDFKDRLPFLTEEEINGYYSDLEKTFIQRETNLNRACIHRIKKETVGKRILDAAAGRGFMARELYRENGLRKCTVCDIVLPEKRERVDGIEYVKASLTELPFEDNSFDTVICTHALEHIREAGGALDELRRVCRRKLLIVLPRQREYWYTYDLHLHFYPYRYNVECLLQSGAEIELLDNDWMCIEHMGQDL